VRRRDFLKYVGLAAVCYPQSALSKVLLIEAGSRKIFHSVAPDVHIPPVTEANLKDYLTKIRNPDTPHPADIVLGAKDRALLASVVGRLERLSETIGYGNFGILDFDGALGFAENQAAVGAFTKAECDFLEMIYTRDAADYGFYGHKQFIRLTESINPHAIEKVSGSGNYLFKGEAVEKYVQIKRMLGEDAVLTSGIRGIVKQFHLFLNKALRHEGNLSLASRSLAPPGYSYHATGDFDIGQRGLGGANFTDIFTQTSVFKVLRERGFVEYRYNFDNMLGVRYEPWHVKLANG